jgi:hypothetical protein
MGQKSFGPKWIFVKSTYPKGLPDGLFANQKIQFGLIFAGLAMEIVGTIYGHLEYLTAIRYTEWPFDIFCGHLVYFHRFGILYHEKSGNPVFPLQYLPPRSCGRRCELP